MDPADAFWKLEHLSDAQLLESLGGVLRTQRLTLVELIAHLAEVEDRRLHLEAACRSMFAYCVERLGMSEDEACRRIELARLARRFPALFPELASGRIALSVALTLKPVLTPDNHLELLAAARRKNVRQARELVAGRSPRRDAPSTIRKLPERQQTTIADSPQPSLPAQPLFARPLSAQPLPSRNAVLTTPQPPSVVATPDANRSPSPHALPPPLTAPSPLPDPPAVSSRPTASQSPSPRDDSASHVSRGRIEPLSAGRYRVQFTADLDLKQKLELARDLLRHTYPNGDFACILARALQLLLDELMGRRWGAKTRRKGSNSVPKKAESTPPPAPASEASVSATPTSEAPMSEESTSEESTFEACASAASLSEVLVTDPPTSAAAAATPAVAAADAAAAPAAPAAAAAENAPAAPTMPIPSPKHRPHIPRVARRIVFERDGLGCSWVNEHGVRCGSRAWLEIDHRAPSAKGGSSDPGNLRLLCRAPIA